MVAEPLPEARQVVGAAPVARRARDNEPAAPEIAQALHQPVFAIGNAPTGIAAFGSPERPGSRWPIGTRGLTSSNRSVVTIPALLNRHGRALGSR